MNNTTWWGSIILPALGHRVRRAVTAGVHSPTNEHKANTTGPPPDNRTSCAVPTPAVALAKTRRVPPMRRRPITPTRTHGGMHRNNRQ